MPRKAGVSFDCREFVFASSVSVACMPPAGCLFCLELNFTCQASAPQLSCIPSPFWQFSVCEIQMNIQKQVCAATSKNHRDGHVIFQEKKKELGLKGTCPSFIFTLATEPNCCCSQDEGTQPVSQCIRRLLLLCLHYEGQEMLSWQLENQKI